MLHMLILTVLGVSEVILMEFPLEGHIQDYLGELSREARGTIRDSFDMEQLRESGRLVFRYEAIDGGSDTLYMEWQGRDRVRIGYVDKDDPPLLIYDGKNAMVEGRYTLDARYLGTKHMGMLDGLQLEKIIGDMPVFEYLQADFLYSYLYKYLLFPVSYTISDDLSFLNEADLLSVEISGLDNSNDFSYEIYQWSSHDHELELDYDFAMLLGICSSEKQIRYRGHITKNHFDYRGDFTRTLIFISRIMLYSDTVLIDDSISLPGGITNNNWTFTLIPEMSFIGPIDDERFAFSINRREHISWPEPSIVNRASAAIGALLPGRAYLLVACMLAIVLGGGGLYLKFR